MERETLWTGPTVSLIYVKGHRLERRGWVNAWVDRVLTADPDTDRYELRYHRIAFDCGKVCEVAKVAVTRRGPLTAAVKAALIADCERIEARAAEVIAQLTEVEADARAQNDAQVAWDTAKADALQAVHAAEQAVLAAARAPRVTNAVDRRLNARHLDALRVADAALANLGARPEVTASPLSTSNTVRLAWGGLLTHPSLELRRMLALSQ